MSGQTNPRQCLRLPPFGKRFAAMRRAGQVPAQNMVIALDWNLGKELCKLAREKQRQPRKNPRGEQ